MLKEVIFFIDEENYKITELFTQLLEAEKYIIKCGYNARICTFNFEEDRNLLADKLLAGHTENILVVTDADKAADLLLEKGIYVVGLSHSGNSKESFGGVKYIFTDIDQVDMDSFVKAYQRYSGEPWEILRTERLLVRESTIRDVDEFYRIYSDPDMTKYMEGLFSDPEDEKRYQKDYIEKVYGLMGFGIWTVIRKEDDKIIGRAGFSVRNGFDEVELGFLIGKEYQRNGYAKEVLNAILDYGRDVLLFEKVQTLVKAENIVSIHICETLGFKVEEYVDVEENIYGDEYRPQAMVSFNESRYGTYVRMIKSLT